MAIDHYLTLVGLTKKDDYDAILRATAISLVEENYPEPHWTRIFTNGSQINQTFGAGVFSQLFSLYAPVRNLVTNFKAEVYAIHLALKNSILRINSDCLFRVVIFVDSSAAIQAISINHYSETQIITHIKKDINILRDKSIQIVFQWIPSHVGIYGNEEVDRLAKRGNQEISDQNLIPSDSSKKINDSPRLPWRAPNRIGRHQHMFILRIRNNELRPSPGLYGTRQSRTGTRRSP
ncbi:putative non-ltr rnase hi domain of reverse transcriptase [Nephila pilipes]|uniref:Putative non-ltr rnase hi domain of reverse transcriptase n=1 Tax=Nephila pilipes TaxID=299642 RepID=A0A8X6NBC6_NEPPI|nr:putative non-ltr rnase hi domain of reverse transcriptase [Nephila pilipes]